MKDFIATITKFFEVILGSPWKAATAFLFLILFGLGAVLWQDRTIVYNLIFAEQAEYNVNKSLFEKEVFQFIQHSEANVAVLWEVHLEKNLRKSLIFQTLRLGRIKDLENQTAPVFTIDAAENQYILKLLANETVCGDLITTSVVGQTLKSNGVLYLCRTGIISPDGLLIGYVTIGYKIKPDPINEEQMKSKLKAFSTTLIQKTLN